MPTFVVAAMLAGVATLALVAVPLASADQKCTPGEISSDGYHCVCSPNDPGDGSTCGWNDPCPGTQGPNPDGTCPPTGGGGDPDCGIHGAVCVVQRVVDALVKLEGPG